MTMPIHDAPTHDASTTDTDPTGRGPAAGVDPSADTAPRSADPARARERRPLVEPSTLTSHGPARVLALCNQ
ncbi:MAG: hypothetical protein JWO63_291 [Frankiales bacterium]|nr:hypothetical protein [Frankiales bacterium]